MLGARAPVLLLFFTPACALLGAESFKLIVPDYPVVAVRNEDAVLFCCLSPNISAENMEVRWFRTRFMSIVHLYEDGKDKNEHQLSNYRGRTELIRDHISSGNVSLRIRNIRLYDEGRYTCHVLSNIYYQDAEMELKVAGMGSAPHISAVHYQNGGVSVVCESVGWYPEPEVIWRQEDGQILTPLSDTKTPEQNGLYNVRSSLSVTVNKISNFSCSIRNTILNQEKGSTVSISDITNIEKHPYYEWSIAATTLLFVALAFAVIFCVRWKYMRTQYMNSCFRKAKNRGELKARGEETAITLNSACSEEANTSDVISS